MSQTSCQVSLDDLVGYLRKELAAEDEESLEAHVFECGACARRAEVLLSFEAGIRKLSRHGQLSSAATSALLRRATELGMTLRSYRIEPGSEVQCTAAPHDDFVVVRLALSGANESAVDLDTAVTLLDTGETRKQEIRDLVVDRESNELVYLFSGDYVRSLPRSRWVMHARLRGPAGERALGPYTMVHTPWPG